MHGQVDEGYGVLLLLPLDQSRSSSSAAAASGLPASPSIRWWLLFCRLSPAIGLPCWLLHMCEAGGAS